MPATFSVIFGVLAESDRCCEKTGANKINKIRNVNGNRIMWYSRRSCGYWICALAAVRQFVMFGVDSWIVVGCQKARSPKYTNPHEIFNLQSEI